MVKQQGHKLVAQNKKARHDYLIEDTFEAGMVLQGTEVKSLRAGRASLVDGFCDIDDHEVWLHGVHIPEYTQGTWTNHAARRRRKLLLNRSEIEKIERKITDKGYTLVPLSLYFKDGRAKALPVLILHDDLGLPGLFYVHTHVLPPRVAVKVRLQFDTAGPLIGHAW